jgi:aldehyde oxidoreductase
VGESVCSPFDENPWGSPFAVYMYWVFMAEVTVDTATGKTQVDRYTVLTDIGKINSKLTVDGQMCGGVAQGIGLDMSEDFETWRSTRVS